MKINLNCISRFWSKVDRCRGGCWNWKASKHPLGYGRFRFESKVVLAHRFSWELIHGPILLGKFVLHKCNNPSCVNPGHLYLGDYVDNARDYRKTGGHMGENNACARLQNKDIIKIREMATKGVAQEDIKRTFGVAASTISSIIHKKRWAHI